MKFLSNLDLSNLPDDIIFKFYDRLSLTDQISLALTNRRFLVLLENLCQREGKKLIRLIFGLDSMLFLEDKFNLILSGYFSESDIVKNSSSQSLSDIYSVNNCLSDKMKRLLNDDFVDWYPHVSYSSYKEIADRKEHILYVDEKVESQNLRDLFYHLTPIGKYLEYCKMTVLEVCELYAQVEYCEFTEKHLLHSISNNRLYQLPIRHLKTLFIAMSVYQRRILVHCYLSDDLSFPRSFWQERELLERYSELYQIDPRRPHLKVFQRS